MLFTLRLSLFSVCWCCMSETVPKKIAVHITHESAKKIGGIGAVLNGVCSTEAYKNFFDMTLLYGPFFQFSPNIVPHFGKEGQVLYSSHDSYDTNGYNKLFHDIVKKYGVDIVYGQRKLISDFDINKQNTVDVINVDIKKMSEATVSKFKFKLWQRFALRSDLYEQDWDYQQYLRIAMPYVEIAERLYGETADFYHFSHEYMGMASALSVLLAERKHKTIFVAHEVSPARSIVETTAGVDISFYNILRKHVDNTQSLETIYGSQEQNPRSELIKRAVYLDRIFAVSDLVRDEYRFLSPQTPADKIRVVYNGLSAKPVTLSHKQHSRHLLETYIDNLFNFTPDVILTHLTRLVLSKGIWRDISLLYCLDEILDSHNLKGAFILLSTLIATGRHSDDVAKMERNYGWPVLHKVGWPDLTGAELDIYDYLQVFNSRSKAIKAVFINQYGFDRIQCGSRVPADAELEDLRIGSDAELGFSIYEPFGIAQLETVPFGGVALLSSSCGCTGFLAKAFEAASIKPYHIVDFIGEGASLPLEHLRKMTLAQRDTIERAILSHSAQTIFDILALTAKRKREYLANAQKFSPSLSWETTVQNYLLPNLST
jgi:hypothetical protein